MLAPRPTKLTPPLTPALKPMGLLALASLCFTFLWGLNTWAYETPANAPVNQTAKFYEISRFRHPQLNRLYQYDASPLGNRVPVVVVPGRAQEKQTLAWWKRFGYAANHRPEVMAHYKFYVFIYDSTRELDDLSTMFGQQLSQFMQTLPAQQKPVLISYSLGGLIARDTLIDRPDLLAQTAAIFGIATPYHGTPMFDPLWFSQYFKHFSPLRRGLDKLTYQAYLTNKPNLIHGLYWVNFDNSLPQFVQQKETQSRLRQLRYLVEAPPDLTENPNPEALKPEVIHPGQKTLAPTAVLLVETPEVGQFKQKLIVYASYLDNRWTKSPIYNQANYARQHSLSNRLGQIPKVILGSLWPFYGGTVHAVFDAMNHQLANIATATPTHPNGLNTHLYRFNDGVIPLSSALHLPPRPQPYDESLQNLKPLLDVCKARVFEGIDHVDLGHYRLLQRHLVAPDVFALTPDNTPTTKPGKTIEAHTPLDWLLNDLLTLAPELQTHQQLPNDFCQ